MDPNNAPNYAPNLSQYDFILNHGQKPKRGLMPSLPTGNSKKQRIILISALGAGLFTMLVIISVIFSNTSKGTTQPLVDIAKSQQEIIRVADMGARGARASATASLAETTELTTFSGQQKTLNYLAKQRRKIKAKELSSTQDTRIDAAFKTAAANGNFDETFTDTITELLTNYQAALKKQFDAAGSKTEKDLLRQLYANATTLLKNQTANK